MPKRNLRRQIKGMLEQKSDKLNLISGQLGITINGAKTVEVSGRSGYVWIRLRGSQSELIQAYNASVSPIFDLPVLVVREGNRYSIYGRDIERYGDWGDSSYLPKHGTQHSFAPELGIGGDVTWVYSKQIMPMLAMPSGTAGAGQLVVGSFVYRDNDGSWQFIGDAGTDNVLVAKPTDNQARMMVLYWDLDTLNTGMITGSLFDASITGTSYIIPYLPEVSNNRYLPIAGIRLVSGTSIVGWDNIYDLRQLFATASNTSGLGGDAHWTSGSAGAYSITTRNGTNDSRGIQALSHGESTLALGIASHAEGVNTLASGSYSHAEGEESIALGWASHVAGGFNEARGAYSSVIAGQFNAAYGENSSVLSGNGITGSTDNTAYTDQLNISHLTSGASVTNLGIDAFGFVVTGTSGGSVSPPVTGSIVIQDEGVTKGSATILDFVGANVDASISGTVARIFVTGSAVGGDSFWQAGSAGTGSIKNILGLGDATKNYAFSFGFFNFAAGIASLAGGGSNVVSGSYSSVLGFANVVNGDASAIIAGQVNRLHGTNSSIISGNGITGSADNTGYTDFMNVRQLGGDASIANIGISAQGLLVTGTTGGTAATDGWQNADGTWSFLSSDSPSFVVSINANITGSVGVGDKIKVSHLGSDKFFFVTQESVSGSVSYLNLYGGTDYTLTTGSISAPKFSHEHSPYGFPMDTDKWTVSMTDSSDRTQASPTPGAFYNLGSLSITIPIGLWDVKMDVIAQSVINLGATQNRSNVIALSTGTSAVSDDEMQEIIFLTAPALSSAAIKTTVRIRRINPLDLIAKTIYRPIMAAGGVTTATSIDFLGSTNIPTRVRCVCAYL